MATSSSPEKPAKRRGIVFKLLMVLVALVVSLVVAFFVVTSSAFFKGVILPKVSASLNSDVTVSDASIGLSEVVLNNFKVVPHGHEQLVQAQQVRTRFSLSDIIRGNIVVHELTLQSPVITIVNNPDGSSNLDPITKKPSGTVTNQPALTTTENKAKKEQRIDVTNVAIKNGQVTITDKLKGGGQKLTQISDFNFSVDRLQNGQPGKLQLSGDAKVDQPAVDGTEAGSLAAKLAANFDYKLANDLSPQSVNGSAQAQITGATGSMAELAAAAVNLNCNLSPTEIQNLALQFQRGGTSLGELRVNGPFSIEKKEGRFTVSLLGLDRQVLNLVGASHGLDFNQTKISSTNQVELQQGGKVIAISGGFNAAQFSITQKADKQTTPPLDLSINYQLTVDQDKQSALIQKFAINGVQNQQEVLTGTLSKPMPVSWGQGSGVPEEAAFDLKVNNLNIADWKAFAGDMAPSGSATLALNVVSKNAGKQLALDLNAHVANFSGRFGSNQIANADVQLAAKGQLEEFKKLSLSNYEVKLAQGNQPSVTLAGSGTVDTSTKATDLKATLDANLPQLLHTVSVPGLSLSSGSVKFDGRIVQNGTAQSVSGHLGLLDLNGNFDKTKIDHLTAQMDADIAMNGADVNIKKLSGALTSADQPAGNFDVSGTWNLSNKTGQVSAKLNGFNQRALAPFLAASLGDKQLVSVNVDGSAAANLQSAGTGSFNADLSVTNLVVRDPAHPNTNAPLAVHLVADGSMHDNVLNLKTARIGLTPTQRAKNELQLSGQVDLSKSTNIVANLTAHADSLDVTQWYDLYSKPASNNKSQPQNAATQPTPSPAPTPTANANTEASPTRLPIQKATIEVGIDHLYLHDLVVTQKCTVNVSDNTHVQINPLEITINNAPIKANIDLDLSVPGYKYNITFNADKVAVGALADTFAPESKGAYRGDLIANANIKGIGKTGTSLKANLNGQASLVLTNASVKLTLSKTWSTFINGLSTVLRLPELSQVPITWIGAEMTMGDGQIKLSQVGVKSSIFTATTQGNIPIADVLANSPLNLPLNLSLAGNLAKRASLAQANTSDTDLVSLPKLVSITGTIGKPKEKINPLGVGATAIQAVGGLLGNKQASQIGGVVGGFLGGGKTTQSTTGATTNAPPATNQNQSPVNDLLKGLGGFLKKK